ncbi:hypothetical protein ATK30_6836 [Amycolatopsis echigonensis]|uniref:Uncharacterized protein n=1 Tax=Amycolatopsis echigonensis TaxID=2576905 RepID=A0A2N3WPZ2_9PSEU|nr:hypothetical protein [Amycolatopsis niigatensis]PKV95903.1 hypothetical protein ATK30_6836 [Amycolatopsis niigatensis]
MTESSIVDNAAALAISVAGAAADAEREAKICAATDPIYAEMMATYAELGELLEANRHVTPATVASLPPANVQQYEDECRALVDRLIELEKPMQLDQAQRWARWCAQNMTGGARANPQH